MPDYVIFWEWLSFAVRWAHVVTAIAWIGSSFYFIALDLGLRQTPSLPPLAHGEEWQVHGGGFYHIQKYLVAPDFLPEHLTWFKWESYFTWLTGFVMLVVVYYVGADLYLIDRHVLDVPDWPGHRAGQHVDVRLVAEDGYQAQRSYSIASPPGSRRLELTVERIDDGEVSPYLCDVLRPGDGLELRGPIGGYFVWDEKDEGPVLLVAGGSGIVPLMAMLRHRAAADAPRPT